jgi:hypothetical protein
VFSCKKEHDICEGYKNFVLQKLTYDYFVRGKYITIGKKTFTAHGNKITVPNASLKVLNLTYT